MFAFADDEDNLHHQVNFFYIFFSLSTNSNLLLSSFPRSLFTVTYWSVMPKTPKEFVISSVMRRKQERVGSDDQNK